MAFNRKWMIGLTACVLLVGAGTAYAAPLEKGAAADRQTVEKARVKEMKLKLDGSPLDAAAGALGLSKEQLHEQLKAGKSLLEIAESKGISKDALVAKLVEEHNRRLDEQTAAGKLTAEQAARLKEHAPEMLTRMLEHKGGFGDKLIMHKHKKHGKHGGMMINGAAAEALGMSKEELLGALKEGKSIAELAEAKGIGKEQLVAKIKDALTDDIQRKIEMKHSHSEWKKHKQG